MFLNMLGQTQKTHQKLVWDIKSKVLHKTYGNSLKVKLFDCEHLRKEEHGFLHSAMLEDFSRSICF